MFVESQFFIVAQQRVTLSRTGVSISKDAGGMIWSGFCSKFGDERVKNGFIDSFRHFNQQPHQYTWWSAFGAARANNKGWRIDYINVTEPLKPSLKHAEILPKVVHSDHCPVYLELTFATK